MVIIFQGWPQIILLVSVWACHSFKAKTYYFFLWLWSGPLTVFSNSILCEECPELDLMAFASASFLWSSLYWSTLSQKLATTCENPKPHGEGTAYTHLLQDLKVFCSLFWEASSLSAPPLANSSHPSNLKQKLFPQAIIWNVPIQIRCQYCNWSSTLYFQLIVLTAI